jgi:hypothetical protein
MMITFHNFQFSIPYALSGRKPDDSVHTPTALPLGWGMTGFQPYLRDENPVRDEK